MACARGSGMVEAVGAAPPPPPRRAPPRRRGALACAVPGDGALRRRPRPGGDRGKVGPDAPPVARVFGDLPVRPPAPDAPRRHPGAVAGPPVGAAHPVPLLRPCRRVALVPHLGPAFRPCRRVRRRAGARAFAFARPGEHHLCQRGPVPGPAPWGHRPDPHRPASPFRAAPGGRRHGALRRLVLRSGACRLASPPPRRIAAGSAVLRPGRPAGALLALAERPHQRRLASAHPLHRPRP